MSFLKVRFWGTRGSVPTPGDKTAIYGGNTSCVEIRTSDDDLIVLDCGTGIRELGRELMRGPGPFRIHLLIGHTHWDHIQGFPFFMPAFMPGTELNIYAPLGFQRSLQESLSGQMQHPYFPVELNDLPSRIHYHELEEGFFRIGDVLVETQYLNHTAPAIGYRISSGNTTVAYVTDHESYWLSTNGSFPHPGDQRHIAFLRNADLLVHDAQYTCEEYKTKIGWGHSTIDYAVDIAMAAGVKRLALFHHDPTHNDATVQGLEAAARKRVEDTGSDLDVFAAAEGMQLEVQGPRLKDGLATDFIYQIRQKTARPELPVIVLTDIHTGSDQLSAELTSIDYLITPFSPSMLRSRVHAWLARSAPARSHAAPAAPVDAAGPPSVVPPHGPGRYLEISRAVPVFQASW